MPQRPSLSALTLLLTQGRTAGSGGGSSHHRSALRPAARHATCCFHFRPYRSTPTPRTPAAVRNCADLGPAARSRLRMDLPPGHSLDVWERAAMIPQPFRRRSSEGRGGGENRGLNSTSSTADPTAGRFRNAPWMVDQIAGHTWDTFGSPAPGPSASTPLERLFSQLGIDRVTALAMARAERGLVPLLPSRRLAPRSTTTMPRSATTGSSAGRASKPIPPRSTAPPAAWLPPVALPRLGIRSRPIWQQFRRTGTVEAEQTQQAVVLDIVVRPADARRGGDWSVQG